MNSLPAFAYYRPRTLSEACELLAAPGAAVLAGGTDLLVHMRTGRRTPTALVSLQDLTQLTDVSAENGVVRIGAGAPLSALTDHPAITARYPVLGTAARFMGSLAIRAQATIGGNLCNASPAADLPPVLLALDATITLAGRSGERELPLHELFLGPGRTILQPGELCVAITLPPGPPERRVTFERLDQRRAMDIAIVSAALAVTVLDGVVRDARVVLGAVAPTPLRVPAAEAALVDRPLSASTIEAAAAAAMQAAQPITDIRASAAYRRDMVGALVRRGLGRLAATGGHDV